MTHYLAKRLFNGKAILENQYLSIDNGLIHSLSDEPSSDNYQTLEGILCPGFVDIQVNGGGGVLFNQAPSLRSIQTISASHARYGTTAMLPTLITDQLPVMQRAADAIAESIAIESPGILGVHFEGPHLSVPKKGIHPKHFIRSISDQELQLLTRSDLGKVLVTLAPESVPVDVISDLVKQGVMVSLGHSNADHDTTLAALEAGASCFTHLFNAMSPLTSREPGMVGTALLDKHSYVGLIVDFHHVHPINCRLTVDCKGTQKVILVTDAMAHVGSEEDSFGYMDTTIIRENGKLTVPDGTLAGSALDMASAVRNCNRMLGMSLADAVTMASHTPANFLGLTDKLGSLKTGKQADMVLLDEQLNVKKTWIKGQQVLAQ
ncbi:N-acetylglucosamine-6-phosphate deacetylase [Alteromonadaceae bacterium M269]|nr:N-acetylglucosamine-6-phosphate deacetylase [Alteromonadaceae bacterium M269]